MRKKSSSLTSLWTRKEEEGESESEKEKCKGGEEGPVAEEIGIEEEEDGENDAGD